MSSSETSRSDPSPRPARRWRGRAVLVLLGVSLLLAAGWTAAWKIVSLRVEAGLQAWIDQRRTLGDRIQPGPMVLGGSPLAVTVPGKEVHWSRGEDQRSVVWGKGVS